MDYAMEDLFTPEEIAARRDEKMASERQALDDQIAAHETALADLREKRDAMNPPVEPETSAEEATETPADEGAEG